MTPYNRDQATRAEDHSCYSHNRAHKNNSPGADEAIESAGFMQIKGKFDSIVRANMRNIRQNLFFAMIYNAAGVPVAAGRCFQSSAY